MTNRKSDGPGRAMTGRSSRFLRAHKQLQLVEMQSTLDALEMQSTPALEVQSTPALEVQSTRTSVGSVAPGESADGSPEKSSSSGESLIMDDPDYIDPSVQTLLLTDVTQKILNTRIAPELGVRYLSASKAENASFPVTGIMFGLNRNYRGGGAFLHEIST